MVPDPLSDRDFEELTRLRDDICGSIDRLQAELERVELLLMKAAKRLRAADEGRDASSSRDGGDAPSDEESRGP